MGDPHESPTHLESDAGAARGSDESSPTISSEAGLEHTVVREHEPNEPARVDPALARLEEMPFAERYATRAMLGRGGMGEVRLTADRRIGRDVAMKMIRASTVSGTQDLADASARFVHEACIQGQLEHPSIVPVYDLGLSPDGEAFFTMRRVRGMTLKDILHGLAEDDTALGVRFSRRKLLTAFSAICLTVDFAHQKGVLHRDLKPANVMLGDFGEVYLLDWGLAKLIAPPLEGAGHPLVREEGAPRTMAGTMLGTAGYMAPEQAQGLFDVIDHRADVYSLGAILFELLALEPLIAKAARGEMIAATIAGVDARASIRAPDRGVPPELEAICVKATARDPRARYAGARELSEAIERYLDGDRDLELRRANAARHADAARALVDRALAEARLEVEEEEETRSRAMREASRALAFDPDNKSATHSMVRLLLEPPKRPPRSLALDMERVRDEAQLASGRSAVIAYLAWFLFTPFFVMLGVRDLGLAMLPWAGALGAVLVNLIGVRFRWAREVRGLLSITCSSFGVAAASRVFGPLMLVPALATANTMGYMLTPHRSKLGWIGVIGCSALLVPSILEWAGALESSYLFREGMMCIVPHVTELPPGPTWAFLLVTAIGGIAVSAFFLLRVQRALATAEERLHVHAWHLRQLVPHL